MSFGRKTYDADSPGRGFGLAEWGDSLNSESKTDKHASSKRSDKNAQFLEDDDLFKESEGEKDRYLITYADLITLLLGLFIILYAISNIDIKKYEQIMSAMGNIFGGSASGAFSQGEVMTLTGGKLDFIPTKIDRLRAELSFLIDQHGQNSNVMLEENERGFTIHIQGDILFPSGSADLGMGSAQVLADVAKVLRELKNDIRIEGHTDNLPMTSRAFQSNWHLSIERALNTAYYLIDKEDLSPEKVSVVGYAEYRPIASNDTPEGRATNRRVDIVIIKE